MPNQTNQDIVKKIRAKAEKAKAVIFTDVKGLSSNNTNSLRAKMKETEADVMVAKNTLLEVALKEAKYDTSEASKLFNNSTAAVFSYNDVVAPIKAIIEFAKTLELPKIKGGIIEGKFLSAEQIDTLSKLPSKEALLGQLVYVLQSPITGFANVLNGKQKDLVYALSAIAKKKEVQ